MPDELPPRMLTDDLVTRLNAGRLAEVVLRGERLSERYPRSILVHNLVGVAAAGLKRFDKAEARFRAVLTIRPGEADVHGNLARVLQQLGRTEEAIASYRQALQIRPDHAETHYGLGLVLQAAGRAEEAIDCFQRSVGIRPAFAEGHQMLGNALKRLGRKEAAIASYRRAVRIRPDYAEAYNNMGNALVELHRKQAAILCYQRALKIRPDYAEAHNNLGDTFKSLERSEEAIACFERALAIKPDFDAARAHKLHQQARICDWDGLAREADLIPALGIAGEPVAPFLMLSLEDHPARHRLRSERLAAVIAERASPAVFPRPRKAPQRYRIGYFSADFHNHATMYLMARFFELHDADRFEIHAYSYGPDSEDAMRQRLKDSVHAFHNVGQLNEAETADLGRSHDLHIAVDLKGFTRHARLGIFAWRAAPVQISYLGYPGTLGAPFIDYIVADRIVIPPTHRQHYRENVIFMPDSYQANDDSRAISERAFSRAEEGLPEEAFVFCCFNNSYKISPTEFDIWMRLLRQVEGSVLWLLKGSDRQEENLRGAARSRGIDPARLVFAGRMAHAEHLARHRLADLFLDTFNVNAHTTASDALWAGLPVLTKAGDGFAARVAASLLHAVGLPEMITTTAEEYEAAALDHAADKAALRRIRDALAVNRKVMPLFDTKRFVGHMECAYERAYAQLREDRPAGDIVLA